MRSVEMSDKQICELGRDLYETRLRRILEPAHTGQFVVISVENGDYAMAESTTEAARTMRSRYPDQVFYEARVGFDWVTQWPAAPLRDAARVP